MSTSDSLMAWQRLTRSIRGNHLDIVLVICGLLSFFLTVKTSSDKLFDGLRGTPVETWFSQLDTGNQNIHDIAVGIFVSILFYYLVVRLPEYDKRERIRRNLQHQYASFKKRCITVFLSTSPHGFDPSLIEKLTGPKAFRYYFKGQSSPGQDRWDAVANGLDAEKIKQLTVEFEILIDEVRFTLAAVDVDGEVFDFLKNLTNILYRARNASTEFDDVKSLLSRMWSVFTGWNPIDGYSKSDEIAETISEI